MCRTSEPRTPRYNPYFCITLSDTDVFAETKTTASYPLCYEQNPTGGSRGLRSPTFENRRHESAQRIHQDRGRQATRRRKDPAVGTGDVLDRPLSRAHGPQPAHGSGSTDSGPAYRAVPAVAHDRGLTPHGVRSAEKNAIFAPASIP